MPPPIRSSSPRGGGGAAEKKHTNSSSSSNRGQPSCWIFQHPHNRIVLDWAVMRTCLLGDWEDSNRVENNSWCLRSPYRGCKKSDRVKSPTKGLRNYSTCTLTTEVLTIQVECIYCRNFLTVKVNGHSLSTHSTANCKTVENHRARVGVRDLLCVRVHVSGTAQ